MMKTVFRYLFQIFIFSLIQYSNSVDASHYVKHRCDDTNNRYVSFSLFQLVLNHTLFSVLPGNASQARFYRFTNGIGVDQVNALYYCRGDVSLPVCHHCVMAAADNLTSLCAFMKEAVVWYEECTVRYSNQSIFFIDKESPYQIYTNNTGIINDDLLDPFRDKFDAAMDNLVNQTAYDESMQGFATSNVNISLTEVLYCVMQCSPDILGAPCETCLRSALKQRNKWADTMIFMPSCFFRVDLYRSTSLLSPPPPPPDKTWVKVVIASVAAAIILIIASLVAAVYYIRKHPVIEGFERLRVFSYAELSAATGCFSATNILGKGAFGEVFKGVIPRDNLVVAVKKLKIDVYNGEKEFISEMERKDAKPEELIPEIRMKIALGTARGLKYLHEDCATKIIHRDIKSATKVADFRLAKIFPDDESHISTSVRGTENYLDPDYNQSKKLTEKSDVYSFGIVLLELITGWTSTVLYASGRTPQLLQAITRCRFSYLIDPILKKNDSQIDRNNELLMIRMMICAALCLHPLPICRLKMSQVVKLLETGRLDANDVSGIVAYARNEPESSKASTTHPITFKLENLRRLAVQVHEKVNRAPARDTLVSHLSYEMSNGTISFRSVDSSTYVEWLDLYE